MYIHGRPCVYSSNLYNSALYYAQFFRYETSSHHDGELKLGSVLVHHHELGVIFFKSYVWTMLWYFVWYVCRQEYQTYEVTKKLISCEYLAELPKSQFAIIPDGGVQIFLDHLTEHTGGRGKGIKDLSEITHAWCYSHLQLGIIIHQYGDHTNEWEEAGRKKRSKTGKSQDSAGVYRFEGSNFCGFHR